MSNQFTKGNSIAECCPELLKEWDYQRNSGLDPHSVARGSIKKVWWICKKNHHYDASPLHRSRGSGCPFCSGRKAIPGENDLQTIAPDLAKEWHPTKNGDKTPSTIKPQSSYYARWICPVCNNEYWEKVSHRYNGSGCPFCAGKKPIIGKTDLKSTFPDLAKEWHPTKNGKLKPEDVTYGSNKKVWWKCKKNHEWETAVCNRTSLNRACPFCSASKQTSFPEQAILYYIKKAYKDAENRYSINNSEIDIFIPSLNIGIEYDGAYYHRDKYEKDCEKNKELNDSGIEVIRIREEPLPVTTGAINIIRTEINEIKSLDKVILEICGYLSIQNADIDVVRDENRILKMYYSAKEEKSFIYKHPELLKEWDYKENGDIDPKMFSSGSSKKVWWKCSECNHKWSTSISHRCNGKGCPQCARKRAAIKRKQKQKS